MPDDSADRIPEEIHFPTEAIPVGDGVPERWGTSLRSDVHPSREIAERLQELEKRVAALAEQRVLAAHPPGVNGTAGMNGAGANGIGANGAGAHGTGVNNIGAKANGIAGFDFRLGELQTQLRQRLAEFEADQRERDARLRCARELLVRQLVDLRACEAANGESGNGASDGKLRRQICFVLESVADDLGALLAARKRIP